MSDNRKLQADDKRMVQELLELGCPKPRIADKLLKEKGLHVIAKDIQNFAQKLKSQDDDDLHTAIRILKEEYRKFISVLYHDSYQLLLRITYIYNLYLTIFILLKITLKRAKVMQLSQLSKLN